MIRDLKATPSVYVTTETHHGYNKIAHMTGLGRRNLRTVATNGHAQMDIEDLERQIAQDRNNGLVPLMVVATAGTTAAGAIDPLPEIGEFCKRFGVWFHVDAAWGGSAIISPKLKHHLAGIDAADSITCDAHKWLSVPMGSGMFFCRHPESVAEAFRAEVSYMPGKKIGPVFDPYSTSAQWSRRFIGLKLFMALAHHGESGYVEMIEHQTEMGEVLRDALRNSGWRIVNSTPLPLVCFTREGLDVPKFLAALHERQIAWMSPAQFNSTPVVRACITSFNTTESDIRWVVAEMNRLVEEKEIAESRGAEVTAELTQPLGVSA